MVEVRVKCVNCGFRWIDQNPDMRNAKEGANAVIIGGCKECPSDDLVVDKVL